MIIIQKLIKQNKLKKNQRKIKKEIQKMKKKMKEKEDIIHLITQTMKLLMIKWKNIIKKRKDLMIQ